MAIRTVEKVPVTYKRPAIITTTAIMADCPIEAVCVSQESTDLRKVTCGHYIGSETNLNGSKVICGYTGR